MRSWYIQTAPHPPEKKKKSLKDKLTSVSSKWDGRKKKKKNHKADLKSLKIPRTFLSFQPKNCLRLLLLDPSPQGRGNLGKPATAKNKDWRCFPGWFW